MKRIFIFLIIIALSIPAFVSAASMGSIVYGAIENEAVVYEDLITYDIWKHSDGTWQATGSPGSSVSFKYSSRIYIDSSKKLRDVRVEYFKPSSNHIWYDMSLKNANISSIKYDSSTVSYNVSGALMANAKPLDIKQYSWQNPSVEGYRYYIPVKISLIYEKAETVSEESLTPDESYLENESQNVNPSNPDEDEKDYRGRADLLIPEQGYKGHRVLLQDLSTFTDGSRDYTAAMFYKEGLGRNSFSKESGVGEMRLYRLPTNSGGYYTDRYAVFSEEGEYEVKLTARINGGLALTDTERINILPVPHLSVQIGGAQKQNRKQMINVSAALNPDSELKRMWIELSESDGSNLVHLDYYPGKEGKISNSELIKTRKINKEYQDEYFERVSLEFLTKNDNEKLMKYTVYAEDYSGSSDIKSGYFTVYPDEAPVAKIEADRYSIRNKGTNSAEVNIKDDSLTFGDEIERKWSIKKDGGWTEEFEFTDSSFGSGKNIIHHKVGVGETEYRLVTKDVIPEEDTLIEYISDDERKFDTAYAIGEVVNIAPTVRLERKESPKAEVLIICDEENITKARGATEELKVAMAEKGIDAVVDFQISEANLGNKNELGGIRLIETPFSYHSQWTSYEDDSFISDSRRVYKLGADFGEYGGGKYSDEPMPKEPYIISAYEIDTQSVLWEKSFYSALFPLGNEFKLSQDDSEDYLYINSGAKTLIVDKKEGNLLGVVNARLTDNVFVGEDNIYSFSDNGIIAVRRSDKSVRCLSSLPIKGKCLKLEGKINFCVTVDGKFKRGYFNPIDESIKYAELEGSENEAYEGFDMDMYGNLSAIKYISGKAYALKIWDEGNSLIKEIKAGNYGDDCIIAKDENGRLAYAGFVYSKRKTKSNGSRVYYVLMKMNGIFNDKYNEGYISSSTGYKTSPKFIYGYCEEDNVTFVTGSEYWYVFNYGTSGYTERSYCYQFGLGDNSCKMYRSVGSFPGFQGAFAEYGELNDSSLVMQYTEGNPFYNGISGSITMFAKAYKDRNYLLSKYINRFLEKESESVKAVFVVDGGRLILPIDLNSGNYEIYGRESGEALKLYAPLDEAGIKADISDFVSYIESISNDSDNEKRIFKKGEKIDFSAIYSDYENDSSKKSFYMYYHYPFNDGACEAVNYITNEDFEAVRTINSEPMEKPIESFYKDGMYKITHWQYDSTGDEKYDKKSNVAEMVFYIEGDSSAPIVESIKTAPEPASENEGLDINVRVYDSDADILKLVTKVYLNGELIKEDISENISPDEKGNYEKIIIPISEKAKAGKYLVVCRVSDTTSSSAAQYSFNISSGLSEYELVGNVRHTNQWDINRRKYNLSLFGNEYNSISDFNAYKMQSAPRKRGTNVFWSEEKFILNAVVGGEPQRVKAKLKGTSFETLMSYTGNTDEEGNRIYEGNIWNSSIKGSFGKKPKEVSFEIIAYYENNMQKEFVTSIIIDDEDSFWRVHKLY